MHHCGVLGSYPVSVQYLEDQYKGTRPVQGHEYCVRIGDLEFSSGRDLNGYRLFFSKQLKDHQLPKVVRQHDQYLSLEVDEQGFADIDEVARCFKLNNKRAPDLTVKDIIAIASKDNKNRFEFLGIREGSKKDAKGLKLWPFKMRAAAGQSKHAIRKAEDAYRAAEVIYCSPSLEPEGSPSLGWKTFRHWHSIRLVRPVERGFLSKGSFLAVGTDWTTGQISSADHCGHQRSSGGRLDLLQEPQWGNHDH